MASATLPPRYLSEIKMPQDKNSYLDVYQKEISNIESIGDMRLDSWRGRYALPILELITTKFDNINDERIARGRLVARGNKMPNAVYNYSPVASMLAIRPFGLRLIVLFSMDILKTRSLFSFDKDI